MYILMYFEMYAYQNFYRHIRITIKEDIKDANIDHN